MKENQFLWSDNWWTENGVAWFVDGEYNMLFQMDMRTRACSYVAKIPNNGINDFRLNSSCIKINQEVYCLPNRGKYIWIYDLQREKFEKIEIENPNNIALGILNFWRHNDKLVVVSHEKGEIIEINIRTHKVDNYYKIADNLAECVKINNVIFGVSPTSYKVYSFDLITKERRDYILPYEISGLYTICYDGKNFWLSGSRKAIYLWERDTNTMTILDSLPQNFGIYCYENNRKQLLDCDSQEYSAPTFITSVVTDRDIWFIPFKTNEIVLINKYTHKINLFQIEEEIETELSLARNSFKHKYLLQYVLDKRYIGLFSLKKNCILEIDTQERSFVYNTFFLEEQELERVADVLFLSGVSFLENIGLGSLLYKQLVQNRNANKIRIKENIGKKIYYRILEE